jgi:hypothetical protein
MAYTENKTIIGASTASKSNGLATSSHLSNQKLGNFYELELAEVVDIILDDTHEEFEKWEDIGKVKIRLINSQRNVEEKYLRWAKPLNVNNKHFPLKYELVLTGYYISREASISKETDSNSIPKILYYIQVISPLGSINHNAMMDVSISKGLAGKIAGVKNRFAGNDMRTENAELELGEKFTENPDIYNLQQYEGDITYEGRMGQSIRFGHNEDITAPNLKIRVGQREDITHSDKDKLKPIDEDINKDANSIWFTVDEIVDLDTASKNTKSFESSFPNKFDGKQIIINSDRIIFNSKGNELLGFSNTNIGFSANKNFLIDSKKTIINSKKIQLGLDAKERLILGDTLKQWLDDLITEITKLYVATGVGPSSPPINTPGFIALKAKLPTILSKQNYTL